MRLVSVRREWEVGRGIGIGEMWKDGRAKNKDIDARPGIPELKCMRSRVYLSMKALLFTKIVVGGSTRCCACIEFSYTSE
jgi:hypothetical protein